jgi:autotransporter-associated beta strand protein/parallel beta-helix repeat protein
MQKRTLSSRWQGLFEALGFGRRQQRKSVPSLKRHALHFEPLEDRHLLSVLCWDPQHSGGANLGGSGTWTNGGSTALWYNPATQTDVVWNNANGDTAVFQGAAGAVTVDSAVTASGIGFETAGYALSGGTITLTQNTNSGWTDGEIRGNAEFDTVADLDTIDAVLGGSVGLTKTGGGVVLLTGANTYSGGTYVNEGAVGTMGSDTAFGTGTIYLNGGTLAGGQATLSNPIVVDSSSSAVAPVGMLTLAGDISGSGRIYCTNIPYNGISDDVLQLAGHNGGFTGTFDQWEDSDNGTVTTQFVSPSAGSSQAAWVIESGTLANNIDANVSASPTIELGSLAGSGTLRNMVADSAVTYQIGGNNQSTEFDGIIADGADSSGPVALTKLGTGGLMLTGENTYSGATAVENGTLVVAYGDDRLPIGTVVTLGDDQGDSGVLQLGDGSTSYNQTLAGLYTSGDGSGNRVVGGGTNLATLTLNLDSGGGAPILFEGILGGEGQNENSLALVKTGQDTLVLDGENTFGGGTTIDGGGLGTLGNDTAFGTGSIYLTGGTFGGTGTLANAIVVENDSTIVPLGTLTLAGDISGSGTIYCNNISYPGISENVLKLAGHNGGFTGTFDQWEYSDNGTITTQFVSPSADSSQAAWVIESGVLANNIDPLVSASPTIALGSLSGSGTLSNMVANSAVTYQIGGNNQSTEFDGVIEDGADGSGTVALTKLGTGTLILTGANAYSGDTFIEHGTLVVAGGDDRLPMGTTVTLGNAANDTSGILQLGDGTTSCNQTLAALTNEAGSQYDVTGNRVVGCGNGVATLTLNVAAGAVYEFDGVLGGTGTGQNNLALTMMGPGTEKLGAVNSYSSGTTLSAGVLQVWCSKALGSGSVTVTGGTLQNLAPTSYYVDPASLGGTPSDTNAGTINSPLATLAAAYRRAKPGDTIIMRGGTYTLANLGWYPITGAPGLPLTIEAAPGEQPIIDAAEWETWQQDSNGYWYVNLPANSRVLDRPTVEIRNGAAATEIDGDPVNGGPPTAFTQPDSRLYQNGQLAFDLTWYDTANHRLWFRSNEVQPINTQDAVDTQCGVVSPSGSQPFAFDGASWLVIKGIQIQNGYIGIHMTDGDHETVEDCRITNMYTQGILLYNSSYNEVSYNYVDAVGGQLSDRGREWLYDDLYLYGDGDLVHDNFFGRAYSGASAGVESINNTAPSVFTNNVLYGGESFGVATNGSDEIFTNNVIISPETLWRGSPPASSFTDGKHFGFDVVQPGAASDMILSGNYIEGAYTGVGYESFGSTFSGQTVPGWVLASNTIVGGRWDVGFGRPPAEMGSNQWGGDLIFSVPGQPEIDYDAFLVWARDPSRGFESLSAAMTTSLIDPTGFDAQLDAGLSLAQAMAIFRTYAAAKVDGFAGVPASTLGGTSTPNINGTTPLAINDAWIVSPGTTLVVDAAHGVLTNDSDSDNYSLTAALVSQPKYGQLTLNADGSFSYTPYANVSGSDEFTYMASDGLGGTVIATVVLSIPLS